MHVERNWFVTADSPKGTPITRVYTDRKNDNGPVVYGLETSGPPVPFDINPKTGLVTVNDTLENKVTAPFMMNIQHSTARLKTKLTKKK